MGLTFKKEPKNTGLSAIGRPGGDVNLKWNKKIFGRIISPNYTTLDYWKIQISVEKDAPELDDGNSNCSWVNITFKNKFENETDAREWIKTNITNIIRVYSFHFFEN